jgi:hypothetical protein
MDMKKKILIPIVLVFLLAFCVVCAACGILFFALDANSDEGSTPDAEQIESVPVEDEWSTYTNPNFPELNLEYLDSWNLEVKPFESQIPNAPTVEIKLNKGGYELEMGLIILEGFGGESPSCAYKEENLITQLNPGIFRQKDNYLYLETGYDYYYYPGNAMDTPKEIQAALASEVLSEDNLTNPLQPDRPYDVCWSDSYMYSMPTAYPKYKGHPVVALVSLALKEGGDKDSAILQEADEMMIRFDKNHPFEQ